jgi:peptidoglycan/LPS O-acetylase OafA/YrhL
VRVFFVLSGFLITALLLDEFEDTHTISIKGFYERRIARIFPVFYAYILAIVALKLLDLAKVGWPAIVAAATYTWNYSILWGAPIGNSGYLLGHFWTLSLEEQFYLVWPALLFLVGPRRARQTALAAVLLLPVLRVASYFLLPSLRGQLGMMFHTGADQILWGALGAFAYRDGVLERVRNSRYRGAIPWLCGLVVFVACPILDRQIRGARIAVVPTLECFSVVCMVFWLLSGEGGGLRKTLESWPLVQLGLLSYSLYIWQQLFLMWEGTAFMPVTVKLLCVLLVATASYRFVEVPMRRSIRQLFSQAPPAH